MSTRIGLQSLDIRLLKQEYAINAKAILIPTTDTTAAHIPFDPYKSLLYIEEIQISKQEAKSHIIIIPDTELPTSIHIGAADKPDFYTAYLYMGEECGMAKTLSLTSPVLLYDLNFSIYSLYIAYLRIYEPEKANKKMSTYHYSQIIESERKIEKESNQ